MDIRKLNELLEQQDPGDKLEFLDQDGVKVVLTNLAKVIQSETDEIKGQLLDFLFLGDDPPDPDVVAIWMPKINQ